MFKRIRNDSFETNSWEKNVEKNSMKKIAIVTVIVATAAALGACRQRQEPLKIGAVEAPVASAFIK